MVCSLTPQVIAAVPEPQTYAMLLAGLGLIGFIARRRAS
ncbi:MAG TPA: FxDxF family PEP-CTERM protein [Rhodocyclaceae bacterium]|nr:FxDxF family PEP-CTERM protein [Rhodocyclaceae bacterium]